MSDALEQIAFRRSEAIQERSRLAAQLVLIERNIGAITLIARVSNGTAASDLTDLVAEVADFALRPRIPEKDREFLLILVEVLRVIRERAA